MANEIFATFTIQLPAFLMGEGKTGTPATKGRPGAPAGQKSGYSGSEGHIGTPAKGETTT